MLVARGCREGAEMGSQPLVDIEFPFAIMRKFWSWVVGMIMQHVNT